MRDLVEYVSAINGRKNGASKRVGEAEEERALLLYKIELTDGQPKICGNKLKSRTL